MISKLSIRRQMRATRDAIATVELAAASAHIESQLLELQLLANATSWFVYVSARSEVQTHSLIRTLLARGRIVSVPLVVGDGEMLAQQIYCFEDLRPGEYGILAPAVGRPFSGAIDVAICPGLAFTERGDRLGSGRGFYDRFLAIQRPRVSVGLALECQILSELPCETHDRAVDLIVTEQRVLRCSEIVADKRR